MSTFVLDTNILVGYVRGAPFAAHVSEAHAPDQPPNMAVVSVVSVGELKSLAFQFNWGDKKRDKLDQVLKRLPVMDIMDDAIVERYAEIDAYSQGKLKSVSFTSRNMGKNDLWIAATASVLEASLITIDNDFQHLDGEYLTVIHIDPKMKGTSGTSGS